MKKIFISQAMNGLSNEQIETARNEAISKLKERYGDIEIIDSFFKNAPHEAKPLWFLGKSFELLSSADLCVFIGDWKDKRGCKMEHTACLEYGIECIEL